MSRLVQNAETLQETCPTCREQEVNRLLRLSPRTALNAMCPYFTMFPLTFPLSILQSGCANGDRVLDPFCGRGTTNLAARLIGLDSVGIDSSPVAAAIALAKLAQATPDEIGSAFLDVLHEVPEPSAVPSGEFWAWAFDSTVLSTVCRLREGLIRNCETGPRRALRAILMGSLHGPRMKSRPSYLSNQCTRTFAPKPRYAVKYWITHSLTPPAVDVAEVVARRARRYYAAAATSPGGLVIHGDSRDARTFTGAAFLSKFKWVITSPPYYGMTTYIPDQWLRNWFLGGDPCVQYSRPGQLSHHSPVTFMQDLAKVWRNVRRVSAHDANLVVRFGSIASRKVTAEDLVCESLDAAGWQIVSVDSAGSAAVGKRQAAYYGRAPAEAREEVDVWARLQAS